MRSDRSPSRSSLSQKLDTRRDKIMDVPNVIGVGLGKKGSAQQVVVLVTRLTDLTEEKIRSILCDIPFKIEETSPFTIQ
jgi:hypothetical protein